MRSFFPFWFLFFFFFSIASYKWYVWNQYHTHQMRWCRMLCGEDFPFRIKKFAKIFRFRSNVCRHYLEVVWAALFTQDLKKIFINRKARFVFRSKFVLFFLCLSSSKWFLNYKWLEDFYNIFFFFYVHTCNVL